MVLENSEDSTRFLPQDKGSEELVPNERLDVKLKSPTASELEIPVEQLEEQAIADDPVRTKYSISFLKRNE